MNILQKILGVNWKTTLAGLAALAAVAAKVYADIKTKDVASFFSDTQSLIGEVAGIGVGIGLIQAKDNNTTTNPQTGKGEKV